MHKKWKGQVINFDLCPLLDPPAAGQDRLDQVLQWLAEQEARLGP